MANQNSGITVISNNAMLDSATSHVETNTYVSDFLLEDVPHLSDYIPDL
ncbi:6-phosphofructokinase, partial [Trifolium medium]|nr:6-phosphofructokinase [Trifolium medium]